MSWLSNIFHFINHN